MDNSVTAETKAFYNVKTRQLHLQGDFIFDNYSHLQELLQKITWPTSGEIIFDGSAITKMDSSGAALIIHWQTTLKHKGLTIHFQQFPDKLQTLVSLIAKELGKEKKTHRPKKLNWLAQIGQQTIAQWLHFCEYLSFIGDLALESLRVLAKPVRFRLSTIAFVVYRNGYQALAIIALLSFMIGVVIAYQMGFNCVPTAQVFISSIF